MKLYHVGVMSWMTFRGDESIRTYYGGAIIVASVEHDYDMTSTL